MAFWSSQRIEAEQARNSLIERFSAERVKRGAYELGLSREVLATPDVSNNVLAAADERAFKIPPGQFALLYTEESVAIPHEVIAFLSLKGSVKFKGLINISGFQVDPGFTGHLKFTFYNAGSQDVHLNYGEPCFVIWFADLDAATRDPYDGEFRNQKRLTPDDRDRMSLPNLSPAALKKRVDELEEKRIDKLEFRLNLFIGITAAILLSILLPLFIGVAQPVVNRWFGGWDDQTTRQTPAAVGLPEGDASSSPAPSVHGMP